MRYVLSIDQSTSGTKVLLFDAFGELIGRSDCAHRQIVNDKGWVSHDPVEIYQNTLKAAAELLRHTGVEAAKIAAIGISNQRETALIWDRESQQPVCDAVVWQCARAEKIVERLDEHAEKIKEKTGLHLSPYFPAAKWAWILENIPELMPDRLCAGTIDSWLIFKLTGGKKFRTDYSNASRTQLFNLHTLQWDEELCRIFGISPAMLPEVCGSDSCFGETDLEGLLPHAVPIHGVLGDSHGALFGQGCIQPGMVKATYGTGSSVMMNVGEKPVFSQSGVVTSLAWSMQGKVEYVLEGNINYTGAVTKWITEDVGLLETSRQAGEVAQQADPEDTTYLVPAFTGLGAPYWKSEVKALWCGMGRTTRRAELVRAAEECIGYQIADVVKAMCTESGITISELRADGGPTRDSFLMQFQSDILNIPVAVPNQEELSGMGAAWCAGIGAGIYSQEVLSRISRKQYTPQMEEEKRNKKYEGWKNAIELLLHHS